jgi:hypothetical protein
MKSKRLLRANGCLKRDRRALWILCGLAVAGANGCAEKQVHVRPWRAASINVRPILPAAAHAPAESAQDSAPELPWNFAAAPTALTTLRQPPRPRVPSTPSSDNGDSRRPTAPSLAPQLSEQEIAASQSQVNDSVAIAQRNLNATKGHSLNPTQTDLASKVNSFLQESKDAAREGDWTRARNLAKKAQVLSEELAASL